ncbi:MAG: aldehyde dehydrogenase family protein, partial [Chitinivibrionales bacterium]|nr:aldehyde dehydrogenase family protein [Chitinivibrionales bacterium]
VQGGVDTVKAAIAAAPDIVFFTGGTHAGRAIMGQCAERLIPVVLELGGCNPCIVDRHTRITMAAVRIAWGKFFNAGQTCLAPNTCYVHREIMDDFVAALTRTVHSFYGSDPSSSPHYARIVNNHHCERLRALLRHPHRLLAGGGVDIDRRYVAPTVLEPQGIESPLNDEEIFGPILPIVPYDNIDTVLQNIRRRPAPLAVYLFSESQHVRDSVRERTTSGSLCINGTLHIAVSTRLPFGGVGASGMGRYHGKAGFDAFSYRRSELRKSGRWGIPVVYPPYRTPFRLAARLMGRLA